MLHIAVAIIVIFLVIRLIFQCQRVRIVNSSIKEAFRDHKMEEEDVMLVPPAHYRVNRLRKRPRIGIVLVTKNPIDFDTWLGYHRKLGIERVYIRVEDTPALAEKLKQYGAFVHTIVANGERSYFTIMDRQAAHTNSTISLARSHGLSHLLHIDDDELLFLPSGRQVFEGELMRLKGSSVKLQNIEAVYDSSNCSNPFQTTTHFCIRPSKFTAYANGKSIGVLDDPTLRERGPHTFSGSESQMPSHAAVVVHYESSCLTRWAEKFSGYAKTSPHACMNGDIPFQYYCDSIDAFAKKETHVDSVWMRWKLKKNRSKDGIVRLKIVH